MFRSQWDWSLGLLLQGGCGCMGGSFQATSGFQDSRLYICVSLSETNKNGSEVHFECEFSLFRIQTLTWLHPWYDNWDL